MEKERPADADSDTDVDSDADTDGDTDSDTGSGGDYCWDFGLWANECFPQQYSAVQAEDICQCTECLAVPGFTDMYYSCVTGITCLDLAGYDACMTDTLQAYPPNEAAQQLDRDCRDKLAACEKSHGGWGWGEDPARFTCDLLVALTDVAATAALPCVDLPCEEVRDCTVLAFEKVCSCDLSP